MKLKRNLWILFTMVLFVSICFIVLTKKQTENTSVTDITATSKIKEFANNTNANDVNVPTPTEEPKKEENAGTIVRSEEENKIATNVASNNTSSTTEKQNPTVSKPSTTSNLNPSNSSGGTSSNSSTGSNSGNASVSTQQPTNPTQPVITPEPKQQPEVKPTEPPKNEPVYVVDVILGSYNDYEYKLTAEQLKAIPQGENATYENALANYLVSNYGKSYDTSLNSLAKLCYSDDSALKNNYSQYSSKYSSMKTEIFGGAYYYHPDISLSKLISDHVKHMQIDDYKNIGVYAKYTKDSDGVFTVSGCVVYGKPR